MKIKLLILYCNYKNKVLIPNELMIVWKYIQEELAIRASITENND